MRIESKLCHVSDTKAIVQVNAWHNDKNLGSTLAEGPTVEIAEDRAISRINKRINTINNDETINKSFTDEKTKSQLKVELPKSEIIEKIHVNQEPSDWSNELTAIDSEIERLNWTREDETAFLEQKLGYNNRNRITNYSDIVRYLNLLKNIDKSNQLNTFKSNINSLILESDNILRDLSWDHIQGRDYLQKEFNVSARKELNEEQLTSFVAKLKTIRNKNLPQ